MRITNKLDLPEPLVAAIRHDDYVKGDCDFSTTELVGPPRIAKLKKQHWAHLEEDASDRIFSLLGRSVHSILEHSARDKYLVETRFFMEHDGVKIGGQIDLYEIETKKLQDWKVTSRHTTNDAEAKYPWSSLRSAPEGKGWIEQGNINRLLMLENGYKVKVIEYVALYRDWSKLQAARSSDYPEHQVEVLAVPIWPLEQTRKYLSERIRVHQAAEVELPLCTPEERWEKPTRWALMKEGQKRAVKLFDSAEEADRGRTNAKQFVEQRPGESTRCLYYCPVMAHCSFGRALVQEKMERAA